MARTSYSSSRTRIDRGSVEYEKARYEYDLRSDAGGGWPGRERSAWPCEGDTESPASYSYSSSHLVLESNAEQIEYEKTRYEYEYDLRIHVCGGSEAITVGSD